MRNLKPLFAAALFALLSSGQAQTTQKVVDIPTRSGVTQRMIVLSPPEPKAAVILFAGGHGGLQVFPNGSRQAPPFLSGFRQRPEHAADIKAAIGWLRESAKAPVWLIGTSRGTQSAAYAATELAGPDGPDGLVLTSTILTDHKGNRPVPAMPLGKIRVPVLVVHHEQDGCELCAFSEVPALMGKLGNAPRSQLLSFKGGENRGDPCEAFAHHGFNGLEHEVVQQIAAWIFAR